MSTALVSSFYELRDIYKPSNFAGKSSLVSPERKSIGPPAGVYAARRNSAAGTSPCPPSPKSMHQKMPPNGVSVPGGVCVGSSSGSSSREHRKLDRSLSEPVEKSGAQQQARPNQANSSRYKTELCRPFEENGTCKYGEKCQFAHGMHELRTLARHPKYKTELCRTFHSTGFCPYGPRCHFIHNSEESKKSLLNNLQAGLQAIHHRHPSPPAAPPVVRPKAHSVGSYSLGSAGDLSPPSSLSASPTSLGSFFSDDPFAGNNAFSPAAANTAFSFSQDFATLVAAPPAGRPLHDGRRRHHHGGVSLPTFGGSQPALCCTAYGVDVDAVPSYRGDRRVYSFDNAAPPSPVDSLGSELDNISLGGSPVPNACSTSPLLDGVNLPRLPIFSRLATKHDAE